MGDARVRAWFSDLSWKVLPHQEAVWSAIASGQEGILQCPTGAGKTYAAFLGFLPYLRPQKRGLQLLYITPLKALARDIELALKRPCEALGLKLRIETRTGDTSASVRRKQKQELPQILITTPESLALLLTQAHAKADFQELCACILDEWHELLGNKRGSLLELGLARLRSLAPEMKTWALSATLPNGEEAASAACGVGRPYVTIKGLVPKKLSVRSILPQGDQQLPLAGHLGLGLLPAVLEAIVIEEATLLFTNTRSQAERWYHAICEAKPAWASKVALHHGSLDPSERERAEQGIKQGDLRIVVCTSSLDLGVDFPAVDSVFQIGSPKSIARLVQRAGRSGHAPGREARLVFVPTHSLELFDIIAARRAVLEENVEARHPLIKPLDVLIQHVVSTGLAGPFFAEDLWREVKSSYAFRNLSREEWDWVLRFVTQGGESLQAYPQYHKLLAGEGAYQVVDKTIAMRHRQNIGTISSETAVLVKLGKGKTLGSIEESFIARLRKGDTFLFAGRWLQLISLQDLTAYTKVGKKPKEGLVPAWLGSYLPWSPVLSTKIQEVLAEVSAGNKGAEIEWEALSKIVALQERLSQWPKRGSYLCEMTRSRDGFHLFFYPFLGRAAHEGLAALLVYRMSKTLAASFAIASSDYGFEIMCSHDLSAHAEILAQLLNEQGWEEDLQAALNQTELARRCFRGIARVSGLVLQNIPGQKRSARNIQSSSGLLYDVFRRFEPDHLLLKQADHEVLEQQFDRASLEVFLRSLPQRKICLVSIETFTPLSFPLYLERTAARLSTEDLSLRMERMREQWLHTLAVKSPDKSSGASPKKRSTGRRKAPS